MAKGRNRDRLNKPKPNTAESSLLDSIVEALVYAIISQYGSIMAHGVTARLLRLSCSAELVLSALSNAEVSEVEGTGHLL